MKALVIGIGCRRGASVEQIHTAVLAGLGERRLADVRVVASLGSKAGEAGLREFASRLGLPLTLFSGAELAGVEGATSAIVQQHVGVGSVAEACALLASHGGRIVVPKLILDNVTVAVAADRASTPA
jgi:cobalt-precorrin 5A hydrolase